LEQGLNRRPNMKPRKVAEKENIKMPPCMVEELEK
jgi:hypothetical protein